MKCTPIASRSKRQTSPLCLVAAAMAIGFPSVAGAAEYPPHDTIDVLVVSDSVNPHGLASNQLIEPGDISASLLDPTAQWGLSLGAVDEVNAACIDEALDILDAGDVDVIVYFAHQAALSCAGAQAEAQLTAAFETHLETNGGIVVLHHGAFAAPLKQATLELLGSSAAEFEWHPVEGQRVINVAPDHFVAAYDVDYQTNTNFGWAAQDIQQGSYPSFVNVPDERYPTLEQFTEFGETRIPLFASDSGGQLLLGYDLHRPNWLGHVVMYQPGEYQPNALDDADGPNRQILGNAIYFASGAPIDDLGGSTTGGEPGESSGGTTPSSGGTEADDTTDSSGGPAGSMSTGSAQTDTDTDAASAGDTDHSSSTGMDAPSVPLPNAIPRPEGVLEKASVQGSCTIHGPPVHALAWLALIAAFTRRRRRKRRRFAQNATEACGSPAGNRTTARDGREAREPAEC